MTDHTDLDGFDLCVATLAGNALPPLPLIPGRKYVQAMKGDTPDNYALAWEQCQQPRSDRSGGAVKV